MSSKASERPRKTDTTRTKRTRSIFRILQIWLQYFDGRNKFHPQTQTKRTIEEQHLLVHRRTQIVNELTLHRWRCKSRNKLVSVDGQINNGNQSRSSTPVIYQGGNNLTTDVLRLQAEIHQPNKSPCASTKPPERKKKKDFAYLKKHFIYSIVIIASSWKWKIERMIFSSQKTPGERNKCKTTWYPWFYNDSHRYYYQ